jgi:DNA repair exonuclease SbcCD nuclease subunit
MSGPDLVVADIHAHDWSAFAITMNTGQNSRLCLQLGELYRAAEELKARGGKRMIVAGDLFHVRGSINPEVFNPVYECFRKIALCGIEIIMIPGNHDLVQKHTTELGNAFQSLTNIPGIFVVTTPQIFGSAAFIPWQRNLEDLRKAVEEIKEKTAIADELDLFIHAGIDGVLAGVPDHGLSAKEVASWGFKRVFAGDYHNHKVMEDGKVISIGATTQQSWRDIGTKAGFLFVTPDQVEFRASHAPSFVELTQDDDPDDYLSIVDGNYVRIRGLRLTDEEVNKLRKELEGMGAKGITFQVARETVSVRAGTPIGAAKTLDQSVDAFIDTMTDAPVPAVKKACADILSQVRSVAA